MASNSVPSQCMLITRTIERHGGKRGGLAVTTLQCTFDGFDVVLTLVHTAMKLSFTAAKQGVERLVMEIEKHSCSGLSYHLMVHLPY